MHEMAFHIKQGIDSDAAWHSLAAIGCELLYASEDAEGIQIIFGRLPLHASATEIQNVCPLIERIEAAPFEQIDWEAQWANHGADYHEGYVHVHLSDYTSDAQLPTLRLEPGPGFGDLSHPTTRLVLAQMAGLVKNQAVIDIGCGSGILALAAVAMGAKAVVGIDIDALALEHARKNAAINHMDQAIQFYLPENYNPPHIANGSIVLMNMIQSEQLQAWSTLQNIHPYVHTLISSGILKEGLDIYLTQAQALGWELQSSLEESGWMGFHFQKICHQPL